MEFCVGGLQWRWCELHCLFVGPIRNSNHSLHEARVKFSPYVPRLNLSAIYLYMPDYKNVIVWNVEFWIKVKVTPWRHVGELCHSKPRNLMEVNCQLHTSATLTPRKVQYHPLKRRIGGPQSRSGPFGDERTFLLLSKIEPWYFGFAVRGLSPCRLALPPPVHK